ncbi:MAG: hypothetical protein AAFW98_20950, partial [Pseudomonadota bacterium]
YCFVQTRSARKTVDVRRPVFVGYVFLGMREGQGLWDAKWCRGVLDVITFANEPAIVPARIMRAVMDDCDSDGWMRSADDNPDLERYEVGQSVKIVGGPLEGFVAQIQALDGMKDLCVEVEMFGAKRLAKVDASRVKVT